jgi:hypothetical protein
LRRWQQLQQQQCGANTEGDSLLEIFRKLYEGLGASVLDYCCRNGLYGLDKTKAVAAYVQGLSTKVLLASGRVQLKQNATSGAGSGTAGAGGPAAAAANICGLPEEDVQKLTNNDEGASEFSIFKRLRALSNQIFHLNGGIASNKDDILVGAPEHRANEGVVRIVHLSDSHNCLRDIDSVPLPEGDILVHSGDFSNNGTRKEFAVFNDWLGEISHLYPYRVVVFGNHDMSLAREFKDDCYAEMKKLLPNATHVLCHEEAVICGLRFFGSSWFWWENSSYGYRVKESKAKKVIVSSKVTVYVCIHRHTKQILLHSAPCTVYVIICTCYNNTYVLHLNIAQDN